MAVKVLLNSGATGTVLLLTVWAGIEKHRSRRLHPESDRGVFESIVDGRGCLVGRYSRIQCMYDAHGSPVAALYGALVVRDVIFTWLDRMLLTSRKYINGRVS